jgi:cation transport ATPase
LRGGWSGALFGHTVPGWATWIPPVLGTVLYVYGGQPFLTGAVGELRGRRPGMMTLVAMAVTVAAVAGLLSTFGVLMLDLWWELALLVVIMLLGHWLEMRAPGRASGALEALADLLPDSAERVGADGSAAPQGGPAQCSTPAGHFDAVNGYARDEDAHLRRSATSVPEAIRHSRRNGLRPRRLR